MSSEARKPYKRKEDKEPKFKDYHKPRQCPIGDCTVTVKRLIPHLTGKHKLEKGTTEFDMLVRRSLIPTESSLTMLRIQEIEEKRMQQPKTNSLTALLCDDQMSIASTDDSYHPTVDGEQKSFCSSDSLFSGVETMSSADSNVSLKTDEMEEEIAELNAYHVTNPETCEAILDDFYEYLISADCGNKDERSSRQHRMQVKTILHVIDESMDIASLTRTKRIRDEFLKIYCVHKKYEARTIRAYLHSLDHFYTYLIAERSAIFESNMLSSIKVKVRNWINSYQRLSRKQKHLKDDREEETEITPTQIKAFERSEVCRSAIVSLGNVEDDPTHALTVESFVTVRDFLMTMICIRNAHRSGVIANFTMDEFMNNKFKDGCYIFRVHKHKTLSTHGPARIVVNESMFSWLETYVTYIRPQFVSSPSIDNVFTSSTGMRLTSGAVSGGLNSIWKKSGLVDHGVNATKFRRTAVTAVRENGEGLEQETADLMGHLKSTADNVYHIKRKEKSAIAAATGLESILVKATSPVKKPASKESFLVASSMCRPCIESPSRKKWTRDETLAIEEVFAGM